MTKLQSFNNICLLIHHDVIAAKLIEVYVLTSLILQGVLEISHSGLPLSIQEAYSLLMVEKLDYYQVYSHLRRIGYVVLRHQGR